MISELILMAMLFLSSVMLLKASYRYWALQMELKQKSLIREETIFFIIVFSCLAWIILTILVLSLLNMWYPLLMTTYIASVVTSLAYAAIACYNYILFKKIKKTTQERQERSKA